MAVHDNIYITQRHKFYYGDTDGSLQVGYGIDNNYARCAAASIASFCKNNKKNIVFHIITNNLSEENITRFDTLSRELKTNISVYTIDISLIASLPIYQHNISIATYFRFLLPIILKDIDRLLYVDADIICCNPIDELYFKVLEKNDVIAAVPDVPKMQKRGNVLKLDRHIYFNAGMILLDIQKWNEFSVFSKVLELLKKDDGKLRFQDQDALNIVLSGYVKYVDTRFNCIEIWKKNIPEIALAHFANHPKPWHKWWKWNVACNSYTATLYDGYEQCTPWRRMQFVNDGTIGDRVKWIVKKIMW